jgi:hypothetical protein
MYQIQILIVFVVVYLGRDGRLDGFCCPWSDAYKEQLQSVPPDGGRACSHSLQAIDRAGLLGYTSWRGSPDRRHSRLVHHLDSA